MSCPSPATEKDRMIEMSRSVSRGVALRGIVTIFVLVLLTSPTAGGSEMDIGTVGAGPWNRSSLQAPTSLSLPGSGTYTSVAIEDIDHDGDPDIAAAGGSGIEVWEGDGAGNWTARTWPAGSAGCSDIALADVDRDGKLDIVACGDPGVRYWDGNGAWAWTAGTAPVGSGKYLTIEIGDVNIDGCPDVVAGGIGGIRVMLGDGNGGWTAGPDPVSGDTWHDLAIGDLNIDGKPDIAACGNDSGASNGTVRAFFGDGTGAWPSGVAVATGIQGPLRSIETTDVNKDGKPDIVAAGSGGVHFWTGNGATVWTKGAAPSPGPGVMALVLRDLDNDGNADIAVGDGNGSSVWLGDGGSGWPAAAARPLFNVSVLGLAAGDLDHDARPDLVAATGGKGLVTWTSDVPEVNITGWSAASTGLLGSGKWADVGFGDVNNDGDLDLVVTSYQGRDQGIRAFLGNGAGCWTNSSSGLPMNTSCSGARLVDLNHDGRLDLVATTDAGTPGTVGTRVWKGNGDGTWTLRGAIDTRSGAGLETGDLNNDGDPDLVTGLWGGTFGPMIFLGNGDLTFRPDSGPPSSLDVDDVAVGDANDDGKQDFAASSMDNRGIQFWRGDGTGAAASWTREDSGLPNTAVYLGLSLADVDNDGDLDLAACGFGPGNGLHVYLGNGGAGGALGWTESSGGLPAAADFGGVELADLDLDGNTDILAGNVSGGGLDLFSGNGGAGGPMGWIEIGKAPLPSSGNVWGVRFGDIDNDGVLDIGATPDGSGVRVWKTNVTRPSNFDHVTMTPSTGNLELDKKLQFSAQAYYANNTPVPQIQYVWEMEGGLGTLDNVTGQTVNLTGMMAGSGKLKVTAQKGLFARGASANITVMAPPRPADVMVAPELSVMPDAIWLNGTDIPGRQENATVRIGLKALGRNITANDSLEVNFTLSQGVSIVDGSAAPNPGSTVHNANGTTVIGWNIGSIANSSTCWLLFDIISDTAGASVPINIPWRSELRYLNLSGPQLVRLDRISIGVLMAIKEAPGPPLNLTARPGDGSVQLIWEPPAFDGNSSVAGYNIYRGNAEGTEALLRGIGNLTGFNDTNLTNGVRYHYFLRALNRIGEGTRSTGVNATPSKNAGPPGAPMNLKAVPGNGFVSLGWEPPSDDGGSGVLAYTIYRRNATGATGRLADIADLTLNDTSVANNITYYYSASARNIAGEGPRSSEVNATPAAPPVERAPSEPRNLKATAGDGFVDLTWEPPLEDGGSPVSNYRLMRGQEPGKGAILRVLGPELTFRDTGVANGQNYYYSVAAANRMAIGPPTTEVAARPWALPSAPQGLATSMAAGGKVLCSWNPPASDGGSNITGYVVYRSEAGSAATNASYKAIGQVVGRTFLDGTARKGTAYSYKVAAITEKGEGPASDPAQMIVPAQKRAPDAFASILFPLILLLMIIFIIIAIAAWMKTRRKKGPEAGGSR